jgi:hypothetical protein
MLKPQPLTSNTTAVDSGSNVAVTWWERNQTADEAVMSVSNDNGAMFGPMLMLATKWNTK